MKILNWFVLLWKRITGKLIKQTVKKEKPLLDYYVKPHNKVSKIVTERDVEQVLKDGAIMFNLCFVKRGPYPSAYAIAHSQISTRPLRFFVNHEGQIIINPQIVRHSNYTVKKKEGCMSHPNKPMIMVDRWQKCEVEYQMIDGNGLSEKRVAGFSGKDAQVWTHEILHLDGKNIYD